jgi:hypothetical protein
MKVGCLFRVFLRIYYSSGNGERLRIEVGVAF